MGIKLNFPIGSIIRIVSFISVNTIQLNCIDSNVLLFGKLLIDCSKGTINLSFLGSLLSKYSEKLWYTLCFIISNISSPWYFSKLIVSSLKYWTNDPPPTEKISKLGSRISVTNNFLNKLDAVNYILHVSRALC